jgi:hypothetical protein
MKTKLQKDPKPFDCVKSMREIRDEISIEIANMDFEQLKDYFRTIPLSTDQNPEKADS